MSYDFITEVRADRMPSPGKLSEELARTSPSITFGEPVDLRAHHGFLPVRLAGRETGFETLAYEIKSDEINDLLDDMKRSGDEKDEGDLRYLQILRSCDTRITFSGRNDDEITAARAVAQVLARLADGYFTDPQTGRTVDGASLAGPAEGRT